MKAAKIFALVVFILAGLLLAVWQMAKREASSDRVSKPQSDISSMSLALTSYAELAGTLPSTAQGLQALVERPTSEPLPAKWAQQMASVPKDSWNHDYYYEQPGKHNPTTFDLYSAGPDGKPGTKDDIGNWVK